MHCSLPSCRSTLTSSLLNVSRAAKCIQCSINPIGQCSISYRITTTKLFAGCTVAMATLAGDMTFVFARKSLEYQYCKLLLSVSVSVPSFVMLMVCACVCSHTVILPFTKLRLNVITKQSFVLTTVAGRICCLCSVLKALCIMPNVASTKLCTKCSAVCSFPEI